jgi:methionyl-tRNA formyltransferase
MHKSIKIILPLLIFIFTSSCLKQRKVFNAVRDGNENYVKTYISEGNNLNILDSTDSNLLMYAAGHGYLGIVKMLVESGININNFNYQKRNALMNAVNFNHVDVVKYLLEKGGGC